MSHRSVLVMFGLILALAIPISVQAATTSITGTIVAPSTPTFPNGESPGNVVAVLLRNGREIARDDHVLPSSPNNTYPFTIVVDNAQLSAGGTFTIDAYIVDLDRHIYFQLLGTKYVPNTPIRLGLVAGDRQTKFPRTSAGSLILLIGMLAGLLAVGVTFLRRRRAQILTRRFA